ncbi:amidohydrolase family protein [Marinicella sp. S1101]|uniref:amidohydrolase family protein n=1 Tax=Marinicella marina TaxID=2996016 RepID=UPI002260B08D|nr:amidohydrolase family protein [Marinicella marina]MCX7554860.1 amidohydrolase family protein [Marinicella marina]MDJ1141518.1 amidohydrolase family protein [Marinicella marina]
MSWLLLAMIMLLIAAVFLLYLLPLKGPDVRPVKGDWFITNIHVVDVVNERITRQQHVVITDGRIEAISASIQPTDYGHHQLIDGSGNYLMPGLWDMHTHSLKISPYIHHPMFIRFGVTSVRDMSGCLDQNDAYWGCPKDRKTWSQQADAGQAVSPIYHQQSSYQTNGGNEVPDGFVDYFRVNSQHDAEQLVDFYATQGTDFIKTYSELSRDQFNWLAEAAGEQGMTLAGHKPLKVPLTEALNNQMSSIEHGRLFAFDCYQDIAGFRGLDDPISAYNADKIRDIINQQNPKRCAQLMREMANSQSAWVPTLTTLKMSAQSKAVNFEDEALLDYIPTVVKTLIWQPDVNRAARGHDREGRFVHQDYYELVETQIKQAHQRGVKILVGTDNIDTLVYSGLSVHHELQHLVEAGMPTTQALKAATLWPAEFSGVAAITGSVKEGKRADLIILRANPLDDIKNTQTIKAVLLNGHYYDHQALMSLEQYTSEMASSIHLNTKYLMHMLMSPLMRVQLAD